MEKLSGIYEIICNATDAHYIGKSVNVYLRWKRHIEDLKTNKHHSDYLQRAWNKYGSDNFEFKVIEIVESDKLKERELFYLETNAGKFNMVLSSNSVLFHTDYIRKKMSEGQIRNWVKKRKEGNDKLSEETKSKISTSHIGIRPNEESRRKMSESAKKRGMAHINNKDRCKKGHLFSEHGKKHIGCTICDKERKHKWYLKNKHKRKSRKK
ncbi:MAG: GIY-YIG nuclease family protein [Micavibrio sp.]|nr:GIY-YIG nuclease family protein [Micavibrio sp.]